MKFAVRNLCLLPLHRLHHKPLPQHTRTLQKVRLTSFSPPFRTLLSDCHHRQFVLHGGEGRKHAVTQELSSGRHAANHCQCLHFPRQVLYRSRCCYRWRNLDGMFFYVLKGKQGRGREVIFTVGENTNLASLYRSMIVAKVCGVSTASYDACDD